MSIDYNLELYSKHWDACINADVEPFHSIPFLNGECIVCCSCYLPIKNDEVGVANIAGDDAHVKCADEFIFAA